MAEIKLTYKRAENGPDQEKWVNEENFIRKSLINLYSAPDTGEDVDQVELSPVTTEDVYVLKATTTSDLEFAVEWMASWKTGEREGYIIDDSTYPPTKLKTVQDIIETFSDSMEREREDAKYEFATYLSPEAEGVWGKVVERAIELCGHKYAEELDALEKQNAPTWNDQQIMELVEDEASALKVAHNDKEVKEKVFNKYLSEYGTWMDKKHPPLYDLKGSKFTHLKNDVKSVDGTVYKSRRYMCTFEYDDYRGFMQQYSGQKKPKCFRMEGDEQTKRYGYTEFSEYKRTREEKIKAEVQAQIEKNPELKALSEKKQKQKKMALIAMAGSFALTMLPATMIFGVAGIVASILWYSKVSKANEPQHNKNAELMKEIEAKAAAKYPEMSEHHFKERMRIRDLEELMNRKMELLDARFAKMGYEPLTEEEKEAFTFQVFMAEYEDLRCDDDDAIKMWKRYEDRFMEDDEYLIDSDCYNAGKFLLDEEDYFIDEE